MSKRIINCPRCKRDLPHKARGFCDSCYTYYLMKKNGRKIILATCKKCGEVGQRKGHGLCAKCYQRERMKDPVAVQKARESVKKWQRKPGEHPCNNCGRNLPIINKKLGFCNNCSAREYKKNKPKEFFEIRAKWEKERREKIKHTEHYKIANRLKRQKRRHIAKGLPATLTKTEWEYIKEMFNFRCAYCGKDTDSLAQDHVVPQEKGGGYTFDNIVPACKPCNSRKRAMDLSDFLKKLEVQDGLTDFPICRVLGIR